VGWRFDIAKQKILPADGGDIGDVFLIVVISWKRNLRIVTLQTENEDKTTTIKV